MTDTNSSWGRAVSASRWTAAGVAELRAGPGSADARVNGWAAQRLAVIEQAGGVCSRCGVPGADTAFRGWDDAQLRAAHTRCVVGLGPATAARTR